VTPEPRTGVVLAAGFGSRLEGVSDETTLKPLTPVAGEPLLLRTFRSLALAGCDRVVVVLGHGAEAVHTAIEQAYRGPLALEFVVNEQYRLANGVSVLAARQRVPGDFVLTMADHVFGDDVMRLAAAHQPPAGGATLLVDYQIDEVFDLDDATRVLVRDGHIADIGKLIPEYNCVDTGLFVCTQGLMDALQTVYEERGDASLSEGVARLAAAGRMSVLDIGDGFWQDVDTPAMLAEAERRIGSPASG
jgi:1L-myo-inositol 1-phosphate cytidylyltransferase